MLPHGFLQEFKRCLLVAGISHKAFQNLALLIDGPPQIVSLAVDLHEHLVEVPTPATRFHSLDAPLSVVLYDDAINTNG